MCYSCSDLREEGLPFISLDRCHNLPGDVFPQPAFIFLKLIFLIVWHFLIVFFFSYQSKRLPSLGQWPR